MEGVKVAWQGFYVLQGHGDHTGIAVAGGDAIDHAFLVQQRIQEAGAAFDTLAVRPIVLQGYRGTAFGQGQDVFDHQRQLAEGYRLMRVHRHRSSVVCGD